MQAILKTWYISIFLLCSLTACSDDDTGFTPNPPQEPVSSTVLVYMVAQNNLIEQLQADISEMLTGLKSAPPGGNWLVYIDANTAPTLYSVTKNNNNTTVLNVIKTYPDQYSTSPATLATVANEAFGLFPAENYGLILSSHANGWFPSGHTAPSTKSFGEEYVNGTYYSMDIPEMAQALTHAPHLKFIMFDACLMGTVEVAYELRETADYLIASPASVLSGGFPYDQVVSPLLKMTENDFVTVASQYYTSYQDLFGTLSIVNLSFMDEVAATFQEMMKLEPTQTIANNITRANKQIFDPEFPCYDFGQLVDSLGVESDTCVTKIKTALEQAVFHKVTTKYSAWSYPLGLYNEVKFFSGLTSYIPPISQYSESFERRYYKKFEWFDAAGWNLTSRFP